MTHIIIGDIHGHDEWKQIVDKNMGSDTVFVFLGDYFDSFDVPGEKQIENFLDIAQFKRGNPDNVVLLVGNHDFHYMKSATGEQYSGYQDWARWKIADLLEKNADIVQAAHYYNNYLFVHAGLTRTWLDVSTGRHHYPETITAASCAVEVNDLYKYQPRLFRFTPGSTHSMYGDDVTQGPFWVRHRSLLIDGVPGIIQVVGHTRRRQITRHENGNVKIIMIDVLDERCQYLVVDEHGDREEQIS